MLPSAYARQAPMGRGHSTRTSLPGHLGSEPFHLWDQPLHSKSTLLWSRQLVNTHPPGNSMGDSP